MKLNSLTIQSVASKNTKVANMPQVSNGVRTAPIETNLITTIAKEHEHTKFQVEIEDKIYNVICPGYVPEIIFSSIINDYWEYPKPDTCSVHDTVDDLSIFWDYLYDGMEIKGVIKDDTFVINIPYLKKCAQKFYNQYLYKQLKEARAKKKNK